MITKLKIYIIIFILIALTLVGCNKDAFVAKIKLTDNEISVNDTDSIELWDNTLIITQGGSYKFTGSSQNVQIVVNCAEPVTIILDDVEIINEDITAIKIISKNDVTIQSRGKDENIIIVNSSDKSTCIKSDGDLIFTGETILSIQGHLCIKGEKSVYVDVPLALAALGDAIKAENIEITGQNIFIVAAEDGLQADEINITNCNISITGTGDKSRGIYSKSTVNINNAMMTIDTANDGIYAEDSVIINESTITISTDDDGIHADKSVEIDSGHISITRCLEGIESGQIVINGGKIDILSDNDGLNAAYNDKNSDRSADVYINGGEIKIDANGDGIDANGSIYINGGTLFVSGAYGGDNNAIDFDDEFIINGGIVIAAGNNLGAKPASVDGNQNSAMIIFEDSRNDGRGFVLTDELGAVLFAADLPKPYDSIILSGQDLIKNKTYYYGTTDADNIKDDFQVNIDADYIIKSIGQFIITSTSTLVWD